jgi:hypothetical protein
MAKKEKNVAQAAVQGAESEAATTANGKRKNSREGVRKSVFYICAAWHEKKQLIEAIPADSDSDARAKFKEMHSVEPMAIARNPGGGYGFYEVKGTSKIDAERISVTLSGRNMRFTSDRWEGIFRGFNVICNGIAALTHEGHEYEDNELVKPMFEDPVNKETKATSKPKLGAFAVIKLSDVEDAKQID